MKIGPSTHSESELLPTCEPCLHGKQHAVISRTPQQRAQKPLELIHSDSAGPFPPSISGYTYFIIYIDDFTRMGWIYLLKSKSADDVCEVFIQFKAEVETATGLSIQRFRCDNGTGEYDNNQFRGILAKAGTILEPSAPYTQHQNGVSERRIRIIVEMVMCMLKDAQLGKEFWAEGASTASYIVNRIPTRALSADSKTPYQAWYGHPPALQHIHVFGCIAYSHIPKKKRRKLDSKTQKCIFLGYARTTTKIWRLWDPVNRRAFESASVVFDESTLLPIHEIAEDNLPSILLPSRLPNSLGEEIMDSQDTVMDGEDTVIDTIPSKSTILSPAARLPITLGEEIIDEPIQSTAVARKSLYATSYDDSSARIMRYNHALIIQSKMTQSLSEILLIPSKHSLSTVVPYDAAIEASRSNPISYREALEDVDSERWVDAIHEEYKSLILNNTWESINRNELPPNKGVISCKWVFK